MVKFVVTTWKVSKCICTVLGKIWAQIQIYYKCKNWVRIRIQLVNTKFEFITAKWCERT